MKSPRSARVMAKDRQDASHTSTLADSISLSMLGQPVRKAIAKTRQWLLDQQTSDGSWCAELEGDTITESETILLMAFLGREEDETAVQAAKYILSKQMPEGGWSMFPGGDLAIDGSVKAYFALKLTGHDPSAEYMQRARKAILEHGGADAVNSFTRFYLALLDQIPYEQCPAVPPEVMFLPKWFPVHLYAFSSWARAMVVPLSIISALRPKRELDPKLGIRELFLREPKNWPPLRCPGKTEGGFFSWDHFFRVADSALKFVQRHRLSPLRKRAIESAKNWMIKRFERSDGMGAIYPPIVWSVIALKALGYEDESPELQYNYKQLADLLLRDENGVVRVQPCKSPVWDTAITLRALAAAGTSSSHLAMRKGVAWLLNKQIRVKGDWSETVNAEPGGWAFEYANDYYPDSDDTSMVLMALRTQFDRAQEENDFLPPELRVADESDDGDADAETLVSLDETVQAIDRGAKWMLAMQNGDGGWGAFDKNNDREFLCAVPFADLNAIIDPSTPDLTARILESLGRLGRRQGDPVVDRTIHYLRREQEADGSWFGRWGVNYVYGTWQTIVGLRAVGVPSDDPAVVAGANWLLAHQQPCGGWGETAKSYAHPHLRGQGTPTASQTAWAIMGLVAAGLARHPAVIRGVRYLELTQRQDGTWAETEFTGTGFPQVYYLKYHYYPIYFPLLALSQWAAEVKPLLDGDELPLFVDNDDDGEVAEETHSASHVTLRLIA